MIKKTTKKWLHKKWSKMAKSLFIIRKVKLDTLIQHKSTILPTCTDMHVHVHFVLCMRMSSFNKHTHTLSLSLFPSPRSTEYRSCVWGVLYLFIFSLFMLVAPLKTDSCDSVIISLNEFRHSRVLCRPSPKTELIGFQRACFPSFSPRQERSAGGTSATGIRETGQQSVPGMGAVDVH